MENLTDETDHPEKFEEQFVHSVYENIAPHFSCTRYRPWPKVAAFLEAVPPGSLVADVGCGNGKNLGLCPKSYVLGSDRSLEMVRICAGRGFEAMVCDGLHTPYRSNIFDFVISIAVIHHWSTEARRLESLRELVRITSPGGKILVYVWAVEQSDKYTAQDNLIPWHLQQRFAKNSVNLSGTSEAPPKGHEDQASSPSAAAQESENGLVYHRYYHLFRKGELEGLAMQIPHVTIIDSYYDKENWVVVLQKSEPQGTDAS